MVKLIRGRAQKYSSLMIKVKLILEVWGSKGDINEMTGNEMNNKPKFCPF